MASKAASMVLGIGFIFSFLTITSLLTLVLAMATLLTYPISTLLRAIGWVLLGRWKLRRFIVTGMAVIILAPIVYGGFIFNQAIQNTFNLTFGQVLAIMIIAWAIYSFFEFASYYFLGREETKLFYGAMISILGILIILLNIPSVIEKGLDAFDAIYPGLFFLWISSLLAAIGSFKIKGETDIE